MRVRYLERGGVDSREPRVGMCNIVGTALLFGKLRMRMPWAYTHAWSTHTTHTHTHTHKHTCSRVHSRQCRALVPRVSPLPTRERRSPLPLWLPVHGRRGDVWDNPLECQAGLFQHIQPHHIFGVGVHTAVSQHIEAVRNFGLAPSPLPQPLQVRDIRLEVVYYRPVVVFLLRAHHNGRGRRPRRGYVETVNVPCIVHK